MHVEYETPDGAVRKIELDIAPDIVMVRGDWVPGIIPISDDGTDLGEYFCHMINEGDIRSHEDFNDPDWAEDFDPPIVSFRVVGDETEICHKMLGLWQIALGADFDPELPDDALADMFWSEEQKTRFETERRIWQHYLKEPSSEMDRVREMLHEDMGITTFAPSPSRS